MKKIFLVIILIAISFVLCGCNGGGDKKNDDIKTNVDFGEGLNKWQRDIDDPTQITYTWIFLISSNNPCTIRVKTEYYLDGATEPETTLYTDSFYLTGNNEPKVKEQAHKTTSIYKKILTTIELLEDGEYKFHTQRFFNPNVPLLEL